MIYYICAKEFGWMPEQIDKINKRDLQIILTYLEKMKEKEKEINS